MSRKKMTRHPIAFSVQKMSPATRQSCGQRYRVNVGLAHDRGSESERLARIEVFAAHQLGRSRPRSVTVFAK